MRHTFPACAALALLLTGCSEPAETVPASCRPVNEHFCQEELTPLDGTMRAIWGSSAHDVWAGGDQGMLVHYDGAVWSSVDSGTSESLVALWGSAADDIWAVSRSDVGKFQQTYKSTILHYDGRSWTPVWHGETGYSDDIRIRGTGPKDIWVDGAPVLHYDGTAWTASPQSKPGAACHVWAAAAADVWMGCNLRPGFALSHFDGLRWTDTAVPGADQISSSSGFWGSSGHDIWAGAPFANWLLHYDGLAWKLVPIDLWAAVNWGSGPNDIWGLGAISLVRYDGASWS